MDLTLLTYTHSKTSDIHKAYFDRLSMYFNVNKHIVLCDKPLDYDVTMSVYDNDDAYYKQMLNGLEKVESEYVIYSQEDYILFDKVDVDKLSKLINLLDNDKNISFIRLIYSGINFAPVDYNNDLIYLKPDDEYYFSTQITIWRVKDLMEMFSKSKVSRVFDEPMNSKYLMELGKIGLCVKDKNNKVGGHYNSTIYPYIATAVVKGKWNYSEYAKELDLIFDTYKIDKNIRGVR
jgi:hypothetical protein